ncbi:hypothetical protein FEC77_04285 [Rickettsia parkeri]|nr:hypothetical protein FEC77_04285 [Rickettsia parkeri]
MPFCTTSLTAFHTAKDVGLYNFVLYGAQSIHFRCGLLCPSLELYNTCYLMLYQVRFYAVGYSLRRLDFHQLFLTHFAWHTGGWTSYCLTVEIISLTHLTQ